MTDYTVEIAALEKAIATGALEVRYEGGRSIRYDTFANMRARLQFLKNLQSGGSSKPSSAGFAGFDRGDN